MLTYTALTGCRPVLLTTLPSAVYSREAEDDLDLLTNLEISIVFPFASS